MKKCPYCAEDIHDAAVVCKHCKSPLTSAPAGKAPSAPSTSQEVDLKKVGKILGLTVIALAALRFWYIGVPAAVAWYLFKARKHKFNQRTNIIATAVVATVFIGSAVILGYINRAPSLTITDPQSGTSVQAKTVTIKGIVSPPSASIAVTGRNVSVNGDGSFTAEAPLNEGDNAVTVVATNGGKVKTASVTIKRILTPEETAEQERLKAEANAKKQAELAAQQKARAAADAQAKAAQAAFDKSKAGQLCKQHPDWTRQECQNVADGKFTDGTYIVGADIQPGTYRTRNGSHNCYYARLSGFGGLSSDIIANDNTDAPAVITIAATDKGFESSHCGIWTKDLSAITPSRTNTPASITVSTPSSPSPLIAQAPTQAPQADRTSILAILKANASSKWGTDYEMVQYQYNNQVQAYDWVMAQTAYPSIMAKAESRWGNDYEMVKYQYNNQVDAYNWVMAQTAYPDIMASAKQKWGDDYEMVKYEYNNQVQAYKGL